MTQNKTQPTKANVNDYLETIKNPHRKKDCQEILDLMKKITKEKPEMWGGSIVGFGSYHYKYASGREGDWMKVGFSSRKKSISFYLTCDLDQMTPTLKTLGKHKRGVGCLYIKKLDDINPKVLRKIIKQAYLSAGNPTHKPT
jgi:hypothetical protein